MLKNVLFFSLIHYITQMYICFGHSSIKTPPSLSTLYRLLPDFYLKYSYLLESLSKREENCKKPFLSAAGYRRTSLNVDIRYHGVSALDEFSMSNIPLNSRRAQAIISNGHTSQRLPRPSMLTV